MLRSYLTIAARALKGRPGPALINLTGLAVGLAACLLIGLWIEREFSFDDFHPDADRIHRISLDYERPGGANRVPVTPAPLAEVLKSDVPEVEAVTQIRRFGASVLHRGTRSFPDTRVLRADSTFLDVFGGFEMLHGSRASALDPSNAVVLTASTARRVFGRTDATGETLSAGDRTWQVTGVLADVPETSHLRFDALTAMGPLAPVWRGNWTGFGFVTYVKLNEGATVAGLEATMDTAAEGPAAADVQERFDLPRERFRYDLFAEPLPAIHLYSDLDLKIDPTGSITTVYAFGAIGLFILLIACINFMNLATARAADRATEVGMRKALGAGRSQLAGQFLGEAVLTTAAATVLALGIAAAALPVFNGLAGTAFSPSAVLQPAVLGGAGALVFLVGALAGSYPALVLSRFAPATVLKASGRTTTGGSDRRLRQGLVVFQFAISIVLIVATLGAQAQFDFIQNKRLGLDKERVVEIENADALGVRQGDFVERLRRTEGVTAVAAGDPLFGTTSTTSFTPDDEPNSEARPLQHFQAGAGFVDAMGIHIAAGRSFDPGRPADSHGVVINRAAADTYGWDDPVGHTLTADTTYTVIGVVEDFHYQSLRTQVEPLVMLLQNPVDGEDVDRPENVYARLAPGAVGTGVSRLRAEWERMGTDAPFQHAFLDQTYASVHRDVERVGRLFSVFAGLAVVIACLGLFGLATHTVQQRAREIGVRKALGATALQIVGRLSARFLKLVGVAAVAGLPLAYLGLQQWLDGFAYRASIGPVTLLGAAALAGGVALVAIAYHALEAARLDPATTLRDA
jgi:putative ABC transport system permease protein